MEFLNLRHTVDQAGGHRILTTGRLLIVANHPSSALDALPSRTWSAACAGT